MNIRNRIPTLDGWRAIAILLVSCFHAAVSPFDGNAKAIAIAQLGGVGVDVFFAISGLLITTLLLQEQDRNGFVDLRAFYIRRCFRVWMPCYAYLLALCLFVQVNPSELWTSLLFVRNYMPAQDGISYTTHLWSLAVETHFYLLWPIVFALVPRKHGQFVASWLAIGCALWHIASVGYGVPIFASAPAQFRTDYRLDALLWGCVFAFALHEPENGLRERLTPLATIALAVLLMFCIGYFSPVTSAFLPPLLPGMPKMWMAMIMPLLLVATITHPEWWFSRLLESRPMVWIGRISFSLYLWQLAFLVDGVAVHWWQQFPLNIGALVAVAVANYHFVEVRLQRLGRDRTQAARLAVAKATA